MPRKVAIIQARMSSSRFPGKVLMPLLGVPSIVFMVRRIRQSKLLDDIVVATSVESSDDALVEELQRSGIKCFRGDLNDVLDRFYQAAVLAKADHLVRLTGDCPLMDADLIDKALSILACGHVDYVSNVAPPSFPDGLDVEAFCFHAIRRAWMEARLASEREHVTPFLRNRTDLFRTANWCGLADMSALRWTIDHQDDLANVSRILERTGVTGPEAFDRFDLYRTCEKDPSLSQSNHQRNEGLAKSLEIDAQRAPQ